MEMIRELIRPELLVLIPVLYFFGVAMKNSALIADKLIPMLLGAAGVGLAVVYTAATASISGAQDILMVAFTAATQGVLCAGCSVYVSQIIKQGGK